MKIVKLRNLHEVGSVIVIAGKPYLVRIRLFHYHLIRRLCQVYTTGYNNMPIYIIPSLLSSLKK